MARKLKPDNDAENGFYKIKICPGIKNGLENIKRLYAMIFQHSATAFSQSLFSYLQTCQSG